MLNAGAESLFVVLSVFVFSLLITLFIYFQDTKDINKALKRATITSVLILFSIYWFFFRKE